MPGEQQHRLGKQGWLPLLNHSSPGTGRDQPKPLGLPPSQDYQPWGTEGADTKATSGTSQHMLARL